MIVTLAVAALAGWATRLVQPQVTEVLYRLLGEAHLPDPASRRVAAFAACLMAAALVLMLLPVAPRPFVLLLGGVLGYFQQDIREVILERRG